MLDHLDLEQVLFLDIETAPEYASYVDLPAPWRTLWDEKAASKWPDECAAQGPAALYPRAGLFAEFGRVICISVGTLQGGQLHLTTLAQPNERELLDQFALGLEMRFTQPDGQGGRRRIVQLCAHNGKEFDFPFIARRMVIHQVPLPQPLRMQGKRPWEIPHLDTLELWKFGDFKAYTSLKLLAQRLGLPSPKDDITGADVFRVYYEENDLARIVIYCQKDVVTLARVLQRMCYLPALTDAQVAIR